MSLIQDTRKRLDQYFAEQPATDYYDEIDAAYEVVHDWTDAQLMEAMHHDDLWSNFLDEKLTEPLVETMRDLVVEVLVAEILR